MTDTIFNEKSKTDRAKRYIHRPNEFEQRAAFVSLYNVRLPVLKAIGQPFSLTLNKYNYVFIDEEDQSHEPEPVARMREPNPKKKDWKEFMTLFFIPQNFRYVLDAMPDNMRQLWLAVGKKHFVNIDEAKKIYGKEVTDKRAWRTHLIDELCDFFQTYGANDWYYYDDLDTTEYLAFSDPHFYSITLFAQSCNNPYLNSLPEGVTPISVENNLFADLSIIESLNLAQKLPLGTNKLRSAQFNKSVRSFSIQEFFEGKTTFEESQHLRADFLALSYQMMHYAGVLKDKTMPQDIAKAWASCFYRFGDHFFSFLFPYLKGIKKSQVESSTDSFLSYIHDFCTLLNTNHWTDVNCMCYSIRSFEVGYKCGEKDFLLFKESDCAAHLDITNKLTDKSITADQCIDQISVPALKGILFSLAAWGLLEIACEPQKDKEQFSPYDALRYVRLTPLGRYAFKIDKDYTPKVKIEQTTDFELNESRLIIKLLNPDSPRNVAIDQFAQAVTPMLYSVSPEYFLRDCLSLKDLEDKITRFKQIVRTELPDNWKSFFDELRSQCDPFKKPKNAYSVYRIDPKDKKLQAIILNDPMLKQYILRAENYMVLIERASIPDVKRILLKYGYIF